MVKVTIKGETFSFDNERYSLVEAIDVERGTGMAFDAWRFIHLPAGSAVAMAGFVWLVLKRNGRQVPLEDIMSGEYELHTSDVDVEREGDGDAEGPTSPGSPPGETSGSPS